MHEPLSPPAAKKLIATILVSGTLEFTGHALEEMDNDDLQEVDVRNTLKGGVPLPAEFEKGAGPTASTVSVSERLFVFLARSALASSPRIGSRRSETSAS